VKSTLNLIIIRDSPFANIRKRKRIECYAPKINEGPKEEQWYRWTSEGNMTFKFRWYLQPRRKSIDERIEGRIDITTRENEGNEGTGGAWWAPLCQGLRPGWPLCEKKSSLYHVVPATLDYLEWWYVHHFFAIIFVYDNFVYHEFTKVCNFIYNVKRYKSLSIVIARFNAAALYQHQLVQRESRIGRFASRIKYLDVLDDKFAVRGRTFGDLATFCAHVVWRPFPVRSPLGGTKKPETADRRNCITYRAGPRCLYWNRASCVSKHNTGASVP